MKIFCSCLLICLLSCKAAPLDERVSDNLKTAMRNFLYQSVNNDSSKVKYTIEEVNYYEEEKVYDCEFKVRMQIPKLDTTGYMKASITKDYKKVSREY